MTNSRAAIAPFESPSATRPRTSRSRGVKSASGSSRRCAAEEARDDRRVDDRLSVGDPPQRVDEDRDVEDALLEQVADPLRVLLEQPQRVARLDVVREEEHADRRDARCADLLRGDEALVGVRRRHADVDDRDVRPLEADLPRSALAASSTWATTSTFASSSRRTIPSRVSIVSSATTTRTGAPRAARGRRARSGHRVRRLDRARCSGTESAWPRRLRSRPGASFRTDRTRTSACVASRRAASAIASSART